MKTCRLARWTALIALVGGWWIQALHPAVCTDRGGVAAHESHHAHAPSDGEGLAPLPHAQLDEGCALCAIPGQVSWSPPASAQAVRSPSVCGVSPPNRHVALDRAALFDFASRAPPADHA